MTAAILNLFGPETQAEVPKELPHNDEAEYALLGGLLVFNGSVDQAIAFLRPEHFYYSCNAALYTEICRRVIGGHKVDALTLKGWASTQEDIVAYPGGSIQYLAHVMASMIGKDIRPYADCIWDCHVRREVISTGLELQRAGHDFQTRQSDSMELAISRLDSIALGGQNNAPMSSFDDALDAAMAQARKAHDIGGPGGTPIPKEFPRLAKAIALLPGEFTILGGIPGSGKSGLGWQLAIGMARDIRDSGRPLAETGGILGVSCEMSKAMVSLRAISSMCGVPANDLIHGSTTRFQLDSAEQAALELKGLPLQIIDTGGMTPAMIGARCVQALRKFRGKIALGIIDHLSLIDPGEDARHGGAFATGRVADAVMYCGKRYDFPMLGLCQLNLDKISRRRSKHPTLDDCYGSGKWGHNADNAILMHREIQWMETIPPEKNPAEPVEDWNRRKQEWMDLRKSLEHKAIVIVAKVRNGPSGFALPYLFDGKTTSFSEDPT